MDISNFSYDYLGNLFFTYHGKHYYVGINNCDELELVHILNYDTLPDNKQTIITGSINNIHNLKDKVTRALEECNDKYENFPEEKYFDYVKPENNEDEDSDKEDECEMEFYATDTPIIRPSEKSLSGTPDYDILIFDEETKRILFSSKRVCYSSYRITITTNNIVKLNIISQAVKNYRLVEENDEVKFMLSVV